MADSSGELVAVGIMEYHSRGGGRRLIQEWARGARVSASNTRVDGTCGQAGSVSARPYRHQGGCQWREAAWMCSGFFVRSDLVEQESPWS